MCLFEFLKVLLVPKQGWFRSLDPFEQLFIIPTCHLLHSRYSLTLPSFVMIGGTHYERRERGVKREGMICQTGKL